MKVTVLSAEGSTARCTTPAGALLVLWRGAVMPAAGDVVDVELDAVGELEWGAGISPVVSTASAAEFDVLDGVLEQMDGRSAALRVGDSIVLLELSDALPPTVFGQAVRVRPERWEAWPTGI